jgi:hypothetical protein
MKHATDLGLWSLLFLFGFIIVEKVIERRNRPPKWLSDIADEVDAAQRPERRQVRWQHIPQELRKF